MTLYVIHDIRTGKYWSGKSGKCDQDTILKATTFENNERSLVRLSSNERWVKL